MIVLETQRLILRRMSTDDAEFIFGLVNEPSFIRNIGDKGVRNLEDARQYLLNGPIESYRRYGFGLYRVDLKADSTPIGMCGLLKRDSLEDVDIGFAFLPKYWSKGYASESAAAVMEYGSKTLGVRRIVGVVSPENQGSINVLQKLGLKYEKMVRLTPDDIEIKLFSPS
jgi:RimJ/RimL family protein N-acetyltransferase